MRPVGPAPRKLLDRVRDAIRVRHYSYRIEETYVHWIFRMLRSDAVNPQFTWLLT